MQPLHSTSITETSSLLQVAPPLCPALVLSPLWDLHLGFSLSIRTTGSPRSAQKPGSSSCHLYAGRRPDSKQAPSGLILRISKYPSFDATSDISTPHQWFAAAHLLDPYLTQSLPCLFLNAHHKGSLPMQLKVV